jgi:hypothetical protein
VAMRREHGISAVALLRSWFRRLAACEGAGRLIVALAVSLLPAVLCGAADLKLFSHDMTLYGKNLPSPPRLYTKTDATKRVVAQKLRLFASVADINSVEIAGEFRIPFSDGTFSAYSTCWGSNGASAPNLVQTWGYNNECSAPIDPSKPVVQFTFESNYLKPMSGNQIEGYFQYIGTDGTILRPWQIEIPFNGPNANKPVMFIGANWFSILDETFQKQRVKVYDLFALAHNVPFVFTDTDDCAGCYVDVGLEPGLPGQLLVVSSSGLGDLRVGAVDAVSLSGDGSTVTNLSASNLVGGSVADALLSANVAMANRSTTFVEPQFFMPEGMGSAGVVIQGSGTNIFPGLAISNTGGSVNRTWQVVNRGDTGALVFTEGTPGDNGQLSIDAQGNVAAAAGLTVGGKVNVAEGQDKSVGQVVLVNGSATVTTTAVDKDSRIFLSYAGITGQPGTLYSSQLQDGVSFVISSTSLTDNSPVNYWIVN